MLAKDTLLEGKYRILSEIGHGGMSVVYLAINDKANKTWAIKEVRTDGQNDVNVVHQNLIAEIETLRNVKHSKLPSIVDIIDDPDSNSFFIVMDYIEGRSMDKILEEKGALPELMVREWAKQLCDVLGYLHSLEPQIIHRDMKPANIMLRPDDTVSIIDFGTAKKLEHKEEKADNLGTGGYAAPEQYEENGEITPRTDIYALGMTLYALLTNINPQRTKVTDTSIRKVNPDFSAGLDRIIQKCTEKLPENRYQSCAELMYDLENIDVPVGELKRKIGLFAATAFLAVICGTAGFVCKSMANSMAEDTYALTLDKAAKTTDFDEKVTLYKECIAIPKKGGEKDAYLGLIQVFREDAVFSVEESDTLVSLIKSHQEELQESPESYSEICFETGKLFWYYYNYGDTSNNQITRAKTAISWFETVEEYEPENAMAKVYSEIGIFHRDITVDIIEGNDKGKYLPFFQNMQGLMDELAMNENESEIIRLELLEMARSALHQYSTKLKMDNVSKNEQLKLYDQIEAALKTIEVPEEVEDDIRTIKKKAIQDKMADTKATIENAFGTKGG